MTNESILMVILLLTVLFLAKKVGVFNLIVSSAINLLALAIVALAFAFVVLENFAVGTVISFGEWAITKGVIIEAICVCGVAGIFLFFTDRLLIRFTRRRRGGAK